MAEETRGSATSVLLERLGLVALGAVLAIGAEKYAVHPAVPVPAKAPPVAVKPAADVSSIDSAKTIEAYSGYIQNRYDDIARVSAEPNYPAGDRRAIATAVNEMIDDANVIYASRAFTSDGELQTVVTTLNLTKGLKGVTSAERKALTAEIGFYNRNTGLAAPSGQ